MATPDSNSTSRIVEHDPITLGDDSLMFLDPCYAGDEEAVAQWGGPYWFPNHPEGSWTEARLFTVENDRGTRAIVVTDGSIPPQDLIGKRLFGKHVFLEMVGVDSGALGVFRVGIADDTLTELFRAPTYLGDGIYPVAAWGENGLVWALAVLTDQRYYDPEWD